MHSGLWRQGETLVAAIGQGYMLTTPLQLAMMAARIANGGKAITPHLVLNEDLPPAPDLGIDPEHLKLVQDAMAAVLSPIGTAYSARVMDEKMAMAG